MFLVLVFEPRGYVINICCLKHLEVCNLKYSLFISTIVLFCLPAFLGESSAGKVSLAQVACRQSGEGEGPYLAGGVGYPRLALLLPLATRVPCRFTQSLGRGVLSTFAMNFCGKMGPFFGEGDAPRSSPRGGLGFQREVKSPFNFINSNVNNKISLEILSKGRSDVAVGCSKRW
jgi:hypothetical protein